jgi:hypothetical protein
MLVPEELVIVRLTIKEPINSVRRNILMMAYVIWCKFHG